MKLMNDYIPVFSLEMPKGEEVGDEQEGVGVGVGVELMQLLRED